MFNLVIQGSYFTINPNDYQKINFIQNALIVIDHSGKIDRILQPNDKDYSLIKQQAKNKDLLITLNNDQFILPGFIDLHIHAAQWPQIGTALDRPLQQWLNDYTFPLEASFSDLDLAKNTYQDLVHTLLSYGTTTAVMFGTVNNEPNQILAKQCIQQGLRAFIGKVVMGNPDQCPQYYRDENISTAINQTKQFIEFTDELNSNNAIKITPIITPRFIPSCTIECLKALGDLASKNNLPIQTHLSESNWENDYALSTYNQPDTHILQSANLLNDRTILAHATQLKSSDYNILKDKHSSIAHCPISNIYFGNAVLPVKKLLNNGNQVGLGTDISGGYSPSLYRNLQQAVMSSRLLNDGVNNEIYAAKRGVPNSQITMNEAFYLATAGGAKALKLPTGQIKPGYLADLQVVKLHTSAMLKSANDYLERLIYQTEQNDIQAVFVQGQLVVNKINL